MTLIEIIERLSVIGSHNDFAIEEAARLKETSGPTYAQQLLLDWIPTITSENESQIVAKLLPDANTSFEIATLALIADFVTEAEREAIIHRYFELFDAALAADNDTELANLLALTAYWNSDPKIRPRLTEAATKAQAEKGLNLPDLRVNTHRRRNIQPNR